MERRKFIQNSVIGSSGLIIGSSGIISASVLGANEKIVLALIGAGNRVQEQLSWETNSSF